MSESSSFASCASFAGGARRPELDPTVFHGPAGRWVRAIEPYTEADPVGILVSSLIAFGSAIGRSAYLSVGKTRHHGNEFGLLVGLTASGRKGEAMTHGLSPVEKADGDWAERVGNGFGSGESIVAYVADGPGREESEVSAGIRDSRLLLRESEFAGLLVRAAREGSIISALLRDAWDGLPLENHTRTHGDLRASEPHVSVLAAITPEELVERVTATDVANGFLNRFLIVCVQRPRLLAVPPRVPETLDEDHAEAFGQALRFARQSGAEMVFDDEAAELYEQVYATELSVDRFGLAGKVCSRAEPHTLRLAMLYALLDRSKMIQVPHLEAALGLWRYAEGSAQLLFGEKTGNADLDKLLEALAAASAGGLTRQEINGVFDRHRSKNQLDRLLEDAETKGLVVERQEPTQGRARTRYWLAEHAPADRASDTDLALEAFERQLLEGSA